MRFSKRTFVKMLAASPLAAQTTHYGQFCGNGVTNGCSPVSDANGNISTVGATSLVNLVIPQLSTRNLASAGFSGIIAPVGGSAPTVTLTQTSGSSITTPTTYLPCSGGVVDTTHFLWLGMAPACAGPQNPKAVGVTTTSLTSVNNPGPNTVEMMVDSSQIGLILYGNLQEFRVVIDGVEILNAGPDTITGMAQSGGASTITLAAGSSSTSGAYNYQYVYITGGTGSGQTGIIASYVGSTKVATMAAAWSTPPDSTSTYRVTPFTPQGFAVPPANGLAYEMYFTFGGVRAIRRVRVETNNYFSGINVDQSGQVWAPAPQSSVRAFIVGDSFAEGTGSVFGKSFPAYLCALFGWEMWDLGEGGTGMLNTDGGLRPTYAQHTLPPVNAWVINTNPVYSGGSFTVTQGAVTSGSISMGASQTTVQTAINSAFGSSYFTVYVHPYYGYVLIGQGTNATIKTVLTVTQTGGTGTMTAFQYTGDIAPNVPVYGNGKAAPFIILVEGSGNDDSYTSAQITAAAQTLYSGLAAAFPTAIIIATGRWMNQGPEGSTPIATNAALQAAAGSLPTIGGVAPFINLFNGSGVGYLNGTSNIGSQAGTAGTNTDANVYYDGTHPTCLPTTGYGGHYLLANVIANGISRLLTSG